MPSATSAALRPRAGYLPVEVDSFVGRRREMDEVRRLLGQSPMVTVVGPGGVGKTRLALRTAAGFARTFRDGVWVVELANVHDPALVTQAVADALGVPEESTGLTEHSLTERIGNRHLLLVLDNCEHLLEDAARVADALLRGVPELRIIATSREPLGIHGETAMRLSPLVVPIPMRGTSANALPSYESVQLFRDRAIAATPDFELSDENSSDVVRICHQLDGIPLAIELAAARLRTLSPKQLADRLSDVFQVLTGGSRVAPARHKTLRHCIDWSYDQCSADEQLLWSRLSVFVGSFDLEAVEGICAFDGLEEGAILDLVASLVDKSIVSRNVRGGVTQFKLLESLREYGRERLADSGEGTTLRRRHAEWFHQFVERFEAELFSPRQAELIAALDAELSNVREALDFSLSEGGDAQAALKSINALYLFWISRGLLSEARYWLGRVLTDGTTADDRERVVGFYSALTFAGLQGDMDAAREAAAAALLLTPRLDEGDAEAFRASIEAVLGVFEGDPEKALKDFPVAADGHRRSGDVHREVEMLVGHGFVLAMTGDEAGATECHERVLAITQPRGESWYQAYSLWASGLAAWRRKDFPRARGMLEESLRLRRLMDDTGGSVWSLVALSLVVAELGELERATVILGATDSMSTAAGTVPSIFPELTDAVAACERRASRGLGESAFEKAKHRGRSMDVSEVIAFALAEQAPAKADNGPEWSVLTPREREVAQLVAKGMTNREIAAKLVISERTAEGHVEKILTKLSYTSRTQIAAWVADNQQESSTHTA